MHANELLELLHGDGGTDDVAQSGVVDDATLDKLRKEGAREGSWSISRFKGLGEMSAEQLWETTLNPETRRLLQVGFGAAGPLAVTQSLTRLMGKGEAAARRELMELHGDSVEVDV
jgi:topoisomerase-4 subunit B